MSIKTKPVRGPLTRFVLGGLCALVAAACHKPVPQAFERPPAPVSVAKAVAQDVPVYLDEMGKCASRELVSIQPQVSGRIVGIHFEDGADLKVGDLLFTIDPRPYQALLEAAQATLAQQRALLNLNKIEFRRAESVIDTKAISQADFDAKKSAVDVAEAQIKQSEAAVETAKINLEYCTIHSPIDGRAGQRMMDIGNVVNAGMGANAAPPLLMIQRLNPIYADFTVTENELTAVQRNMAKGALKVEVRLPDEPEKPIIGQLTFVDTAVKEGTGTVRLRATVANTDRRLWPGRFVNVRLVLDTITGAVLVPAAAPQTAAKGLFVYVVKDDSTAEMRPIKPGQRHGGLLVIEEGVKAGERVVVDGQMGVTPGGKVKVEEARSEAASPTQPKPVADAGKSGARQ